MNWPKAKFKDVAKVVTGSTPKKSAANYGGDIPFVTPGDLGIHANISEAKVQLTKSGAESARELPKGAVLVCCIGATIGKVGIASRSVVTNQQINSLVFDEEKVHPKYGYYFCTTLTPFLVHRSSSTTMPIVNKTNFSEIEIPLPPLAEQQRIAAILDKADALRRKRQQAIDLADQFLRSVFLDMFGDPVSNPKGWDVFDLKDVARIQIGPFGTQLHKEDYVSGGIPLINPTHIGGGKIIPNENLTITVEKHEELPEYHLRIGDIVMGRRGEMGRCAVVTDREHGWMCGTGSLYIRPQTQGVFSEYLYTVLSSSAIKSYLESESLGATMPNLNKGIVGGIKIPVPDQSALNKFVLIRERALALLSKNKQFSSTDLFPSISQQAFQGEL